MVFLASHTNYSKEEIREWFRLMKQEKNTIYMVSRIFILSCETSYSGFIEDNPSGTMTKVVVVYSFVSKESTNDEGQDDGDVQRSPLWGQGEDIC